MLCYSFMKIYAFIFFSFIILIVFELLSNSVFSVAANMKILFTMALMEPQSDMVGIMSFSEPHTFCLPTSFCEEIGCRCPKFLKK